MSRRHPSPLPRGEGPRNLVIVVNPGSTSTKLAVYRGEQCLASETINHPKEELAKYACVANQYAFRRDEVLKFLADRGVNLDEVAAVAGRGGLTKPIPGGVYRVNAKLIRDVRSAKWGEHSSNLGAPIARNRQAVRRTGVYRRSGHERRSSGRFRAMRAIRRSSGRAACTPCRSGRPPAGPPMNWACPTIRSILSWFTWAGAFRSAPTARGAGRLEQCPGRRRTFLARAQRLVAHRPAGELLLLRQIYARGGVEGAGGARRDFRLSRHEQLPRRWNSGFAKATPRPAKSTRRWPIRLPSGWGRPRRCFRAR